MSRTEPGVRPAAAEAAAIRASTAARARATTSSRSASPLIGSSFALLAARAARLNRDALAIGLPALWFFTDPARTLDPISIAARLPTGTGIVYRHFGAPDRLAVARALARLCARRGLVLLIGADAPLARRVGAAGLHLPERAIAEVPRLPTDWIVTAAAHSPAALARAARAGADAAFLSPVFATRSGATPPLGPARASAWARAAALPVYALGGINMQTAPRLTERGFAGFAAIDAFVETRL